MGKTCILDALPTYAAHREGCAYREYNCPSFQLAHSATETNEWRANHQCKGNYLLLSDAGQCADCVLVILPERKNDGEEKEVKVEKSKNIAPQKTPSI